MASIPLRPHTTAINASTLRAIGDAPSPIPWALQSFTADILSPDSGLQDLLDAEITIAGVYHDKNTAHEFLMACIKTPTTYPGLPSTIWLRCERFPIPQTPRLHMFSSKPTVAEDKVTLSFNFPQLCNVGEDDLILQSKLDNAKLYHLVDLLSVLHEESPFYILKSQNCWFFAATIIGAMQCLQQTWLVAPKTTWVKKALQGMDSGGKAVSDVVHRRFLEHWVEGGSKEDFSSLLHKAWLTPSYCPAAKLLSVNTIPEIVSVIQKPRRYCSQYPGQPALSAGILASMTPALYPAYGNAFPYGSSDLSYPEPENGFPSDDDDDDDTDHPLAGVRIRM